MFDPLYIIIEFGLGLAGFAGIVVALSGDPRIWSEGERVRVFGLLISALLASFTSFLCLTLAEYYPSDMAIRISSAVFFGVGLIFFPKQVLRTFYIYRTKKENYSWRVSAFLTVVTVSIQCMSLAAAIGAFSKPLFLFYGALSLTLLFSAVTYIRLLLYRPVGVVEKKSKKGK